MDFNLLLYVEIILTWILFWTTTYAMPYVCFVPQDAAPHLTSSLMQLLNTGYDEICEVKNNDNFIILF